MNAMQDSRRAALNIEEAALLPAMPRKRMAGSAALQSALRAAQAMDGKTTSNAVAVNAPFRSRHRMLRLHRLSCPRRPGPPSIMCCSEELPGRPAQTTEINDAGEPLAGNQA